MENKSFLTEFHMISRNKTEKKMISTVEDYRKERVKPSIAYRTRGGISNFFLSP